MLPITKRPLIVISDLLEKRITKDDVYITHPFIHHNISGEITAPVHLVDNEIGRASCR